MRTHVAGMEWSVRRMRRRRWTPLSFAVAAVAGLVLASLVIALLLLTVVTLLLAAGVYLSYRTLRWMVSGSRRRRAARPRARQRPALPLVREAAGLLEMARTADPLDRYLIAVREYDRLSGTMLSLDPIELGKRKTHRRAVSLADQTATLQEAVQEIERDVSAIDRSSPALSGIWELSVAVGELAIYGNDLAASPRALSLGDARRFVARRTSLLARRDALTERLRTAVLHPRLAQHDLPHQP